jgi:hypothetical protein
MALQRGGDLTSLPPSKDFLKVMQEKIFPIMKRRAKNWYTT